MTLKLSIKLVLSCLVSHLVNKFKVSNFDWHDWRTVARVGPDLNSLKQRFWHDCKQPPFSPIDWNVLQDCLHAVIDYQKDQISFHNSFLTICWVNLEVFPTLGTRYGLISGIKALFSNSQIGQQTFMTNSLKPNPSRIERVGDWLFHALVIIENSRSFSSSSSSICFTESVYHLFSQDLKWETIVFKFKQKRKWLMCPFTLQFLPIAF